MSTTPPPDAADPSPTGPRWLRRAPVRVVFLLLLGLGVLAGAGFVGAVVRALAAGLGPSFAGLLASLVGAAFALGLYVLLVRLVERRPVVELAPGAAPGGLTRGVLLGLGLFAAVIGLIALFGGYRIVGAGSVAGASGLLGVAVYSGVVEELAFRGALFRITEELAGTWVSLAVSAVLFGAIHLLNPDATPWGAVAIALEAGVLLGAAYVLTRRLWVAIGLHFAWNLAQGAIFGLTISGSGTGGGGLLRGELSGPPALSGGSFGPEASVPAVVICLAAGIVLLVRAAWTGQIRPPRWRRRETVTDGGDAPGSGLRQGS